MQGRKAHLRIVETGAPGRTQRFFTDGNRAGKAPVLLATTRRLRRQLADPPLCGERISRLTAVPGRTPVRRVWRAPTTRGSDHQKRGTRPGCALRCRICDIRKHRNAGGRVTAPARAPRAVDGRIDGGATRISRDRPRGGRETGPPPARPPGDSEMRPQRQCAGFTVAGREVYGAPCGTP